MSFYLAISVGDKTYTHNHQYDPKYNHNPIIPQLYEIRKDTVENSIWYHELVHNISFTTLFICCQIKILSRFIKNILINEDIVTRNTGACTPVSTISF